VIVLDTNVISELMRPSPSVTVLRWMAAMSDADLFTTAPGVSLLPDGKRKSALRVGARKIFDEDFAGRILPFRRRAAQEWADIRLLRRRAGKPISQTDSQIAAVCAAYGAAVATRNVADFQDCGVAVVNPFEAP
jgi:predicted nucleic acid-binding protein